MVIRQAPKDNQIGAEVKVDVFVVDSENEEEILLMEGEEIHGFQEGAEEEMQEEEWDRRLEEETMDHLIHLDAMCAGCVIIWAVTVPKAQRLLEEVVPPTLELSPDHCIEAHPALGVEECVIVLAG